MRKNTTFLVVAALFAAFASHNLRAQSLVNIETTAVGDPNNAADTRTGLGSVAYEFSVSKFEVTNDQYAAFLNAVDPDGLNPQAVYVSNMGTEARGGINFSSLAAQGAKYGVKQDMGNKPVNMVGWFQAARFANWVNNGAVSFGSTAASFSAIETGAYSLNGQSSGVFFRNINAVWWIPSSDEFYKAAFYKSGSLNAGYWSYPTQSDVAPGTVTADSTGTGSAGASGNFANHLETAQWNSLVGNLTTVGSNGGPSAYGTHDMGGNVWEWLDTWSNSNVYYRGGATLNDASQMLYSTAYTTYPDNTGGNNVGFRVATVPEPSTYALLIMGAAGVLWWSRRKR